MESNMHLRFDSSIEQIADINESFASAILRICYDGPNRNGSNITREAIDRAVPTMFNCPVVCNYDVEADEIGGHDMALVHTNDGGMRIINLTNAVGVIPSGARYWWDLSDTDELHQYFCTEVILWKRSPAYQKIANDGIVGQSMEIDVKRGAMEDGVFRIDDFIFTAFCLLGESTAPCFEGANLQVFSAGEMKAQFEQMMLDYNATFDLVQPPSEVTDTDIKEGGESQLEEKIALLAEFHLTQEELEFSLDEYSLEELREKFEAMTAEATAPEADASAPGAQTENFALEGQYRDELAKVVEQAETINDGDWSYPRYFFLDYDRDAGEVYVEDMTDWNVYGFAYAFDGDRAVVDFESKRRMKWKLEPFDEGEQVMPFAQMFSTMQERYASNDAMWSEKYQLEADKISAMESELQELRQYKANAENAIAQDARDELLSQFEDLSGDEAFEALVADAMQYDLETLEEKCYALRGRRGTTQKFSYTPRSNRISVQPDELVENEPYGGLFQKYANK